MTAINSDVFEVGFGSSASACACAGGGGDRFAGSSVRLRAQRGGDDVRHVTTSLLVTDKETRTHGI
jgi:hypothetical protein